jgi:hypothetical protein
LKKYIKSMELASSAQGFSLFFFIQFSLCNFDLSTQIKFERKVAPFGHFLMVFTVPEHYRLVQAKISTVFNVSVGPGQL